VGVREKENINISACGGRNKHGCTSYHAAKVSATEKNIFTPEPHINRNTSFREKIKQAEIIWLEPIFKMQCRIAGAG